MKSFVEYNGRLHNKRILYSVPLMPLEELEEKFPITEKAAKTVITGRKAIEDILTDKDPHRMLAVVGPCSIHDTDAALEYAEKLNNLRNDVKDNIELVMRVYFEKPRSSIGWRGLISDPSLNGSFNIQEGLNKSRKLLVDISEMGLPAATEALNPNFVQDLSGLISLAAIGARTAESQPHREMASGLSMPVGIKNGTNGEPYVAINAMIAIREPSQFIGPDKNGMNCIQYTKGNPSSFLILRGGKSTGPGYSEFQVDAAQETLRRYGLPDKVMVDCSHDNSARWDSESESWVKDYLLQSRVLENVVRQHKNNQGVFGFMIESNLYEGSQKLDIKHPENLKYGVSVTDACVGFEQTREMLLRANDQIAA